MLCYLAVFLPLAWLLRQFHNVLYQRWDPERATYFDPPLQHDRSVADNGNRREEMRQPTLRKELPRLEQEKY